MKIFIFNHFAAIISRPGFSRCDEGSYGWRQQLEHFHFENALLTRKRQPPQRSVHSGENRVFCLNATFDFQKKSKVICSNEAGAPLGGEHFGFDIVQTRHLKVKLCGRLPGAQPLFDAKIDDAPQNLQHILDGSGLAVRIFI
ncbi:hypothetical protein [Desulfovibrio sp. ZJ200]|uniref:hypothetical protein n=1 Tax=Desulfovibrio sp. ZJ200 TaxID=2709792 RepID=UPI0013ED0160|nr:hypothetical protein [Desulfovibrio sp. ZJ200]